MRVLSVPLLRTVVGGGPPTTRQCELPLPRTIEAIEVVRLWRSLPMIFQPLTG